MAIGKNQFTPLATRIFNNIYDILNDKFPNFQRTPFPVVVGHVSIDENRQRGATPRSKHLVGEAIDIQVTPNTDERKCVLATIAEYAFIKEDVGSEIAIKWGLNGHVHIAVIPYKGVHKRFALNGMTEAWTSCSERNVVALKKTIMRYATGKTEIIETNTLDIDMLSGEKYHNELLAMNSNIIKMAMSGEKMFWKYDFTLSRMPEIESKLENLNTSPVINWDLHKAIDNASSW